MHLRKSFTYTLAFVICFSLFCREMRSFGQQQGDYGCSTILTGNAYLRTPDCRWKGKLEISNSTTWYSCIEQLRFIDDSVVELMLGEDLLYRRYVLTSKTVLIQLSDMEGFDDQTSGFAYTPGDRTQYKQPFEVQTLEFSIGSGCNLLQDEYDGIYIRTN